MMTPTDCLSTPIRLSSRLDPETYSRAIQRRHEGYLGPNLIYDCFISVRCLDLSLVSIGEVRTNPLPWHWPRLVWGKFFMKIAKMLGAAASASALFCAVPALAQQAPAGTYNFDYSATGYSGSGSLTVDATGHINAISGTANGDTITGLSTYASADQALFDTINGIVPDFSGFAFATSTNMFSIGDTGLGDIGITDVNSNPNGYCCGTHPLTLNISAAVPEPATWAMMLLGFGAMGFAMRRPKREKALFAQLG